MREPWWRPSVARHLGGCDNNNGRGSIIISHGMVIRGAPAGAPFFARFQRSYIAQTVRLSGRPRHTRQSRGLDLAGHLIQHLNKCSSVGFRYAQDNPDRDRCQGWRTGGSFSTTGGCKPASNYLCLHGWPNQLRRHRDGSRTLTLARQSSFASSSCDQNPGGKSTGQTSLLHRR